MCSVRIEIDRIIKTEGYEKLRVDWKKLCKEVIANHPKEAVQILQVLQQTENRYGRNSSRRP